MENDQDRLSRLLSDFLTNPHDPFLQPVARELADRFTMDQLQCMVPRQGKELRHLFDHLLGRTPSSVV